jgi:hypothetical protein
MVSTFSDWADKRLAELLDSPRRPVRLIASSSICWATVIDSIWGWNLCSRVRLIVFHLFALADALQELSENRRNIMSVSFALVQSEASIQVCMPCQIIPRHRIFGLMLYLKDRAYRICG